jgi:hypothetical protein
VYDYLENLVAADKLSGDAASMRTVQWACVLLMRAAESAHDGGTAQRFQFLASRAANKYDRDAKA